MYSSTASLQMSHLSMTITLLLPPTNYFKQISLIKLLPTIFFSSNINNKQLHKETCAMAAPSPSKKNGIKGGITKHKKYANAKTNDAAIPKCL